MNAFDKILAVFDQHTVCGNYMPATAKVHAVETKPKGKSKGKGTGSPGGQERRRASSAMSSPEDRGSCSTEVRSISLRASALVLPKVESTQGADAQSTLLGGSIVSALVAQSLGFGKELKEHLL